MSELRVENVTFGYAGAPPLLQRISFSMTTGETVALIGGNASGKTTLLRIMAGLLKPADGSVTVDGKSVFDSSCDVALLFQNPDHQMVAATVEEEIALGLEFRGMNPRTMRKVVDEHLRRFGLEDLQYRSPESLSGGQKQRVALASVMVLRPAFLLLDEPDSFLDGPSRREFRKAVDSIRAGTGMLWVSPDPRRIPDADRIMFLDGGSLIECTTDELCRKLELDFPVRI